MLTSSQQDYLYQIIVASIGEDSAIRAVKDSFNDDTVSVVEEMIAANDQCNAAMKELFKELLGAAGSLSRGWLKKVLKTSKKIISKSDMKGYACMAVSKSKWKSAIIISVS